MVEQVAPVQVQVPPKPNVAWSKIWVPVLLILLPFIGFYGGYLYGAGKHAQVEQSTQANAPTPTQAASLNTLAAILSHYCETDKKVMLSQLPFIFSETLKEQYGIKKEVVPCDSGSSENALYVMAGEVGTEYLVSGNFFATGNTRPIFYIFHKKSVFCCIGNPFASLENYNTFVFNNKTYGVKFLYPDGGGRFLTDLAYVDLIGEKSDTANDINARIIKIVDLKNVPFVKVLIKKYGEKIVNANSNEEYGVAKNPEEKSKLFEKEVMAEAVRSHIFDDAAKELETDLEGITFK